MVLCVQGSSARFTAQTEKLPIDAAIVGIVDQVHVGDQQLAVAALAGGFFVANLLRKWHGSFARTGVNWTSQNHTGEFVELASWGPGSDSIKRWIRNTDLHSVMTGALALS